MKITRTSPISGKENTLDLPITEQMMTNWNRGMCIQDAMPNLSAVEREFLLTGLTAEEWKELFDNKDDGDM